MLLATAQSGETRTTFIETSTPTVETTQTTGYVGGVPFSGTTTSYGTSTKTVPITVTRFDQEGYFLRNVGDVEPLWEHVRSDYARTAPSDLDGIWYSDNYELELFRSGKNIVAFINSPPSDRPDWRSGDLKFIFDAGLRTGVYLWGDRTPQPSSFGVNRFGHLEVDLKLMGQTVSFARK